MTSQIVSATTSFEIEVNLSGTFQPGCAAWGGGRFERPTNPPEDDSVEDVEVCGLVALRFKGPSTNLLAGVDLKNPEVRKLLDNIANFLGDEAAEILMLEAAA
jgi:hypothetical protein